MISGFEAAFGPRLDEEVETPIEPMFFVTEPKEESHVATVIKAAKEKPSSTLVKVKVVGNYRVLHDAQPYVGGDVVEIPADKAKSWISQRWVEEIVEGTK